MIDADRSAVYAAEDQWSAVLDRGGVIDFFGSTLDLPCQRKFGALEHMQYYISAITSEPVKVRARKGSTRAHFDPTKNEIAIPMDVTWAARESVLLHEVAHALTYIQCADLTHGRKYRITMLALVREHLSPQAELILAAGYAAQGLSQGTPHE